MRVRVWLRSLAAFSTLGLRAVAALAQASADPNLVHRALLGPPPGPSPMALVDGSRAQRAHFEFPQEIGVNWRARVTGPVTAEPVVDQLGRVVIVHERGSLSELDAKGATRWSLRLGDAAPSTGPALLSGGVRVVLNHDNRLLRISEDGKLLGSHATGLSGAAKPLLPLRDGGLALAAGNSVLRLDQAGRAIARAELTGDALMLLALGARVLVVSESGAVQRFYATGKLLDQGHFGHRLRNVALRDGTLYAVTADNQLMSLELKTRAIRTLFKASQGKGLLPQLALGVDSVHVMGQDGILRRISGTGHEVTQTSFSGGPADSGGALGALRGSSALMLADQHDRLIVARAGAETLLIQADGSQQRIAGSACLSPSALTPLSGNGVLLTCRSGELIAMARSAGARPNPNGAQ